MLRSRIRNLLVVAASVIAVASIANSRSYSSPAAPEPHRTPALDFILGTWTGTSTCVGNRPACKDETVVYRFVAFEGHPEQVRLLGDKIVQGKRVPMGALVFDVAQESRTVRSEFTRGQTHGVWSFTVADSAMTGTLVILPDSSSAREVTVHRVNERDVPEAPPPSDYDE
jgi:hypothetical protein